ncbi:MAG TPA: NAD-dependent epimerase/dehydratase family protein [Cyclobacteriaceae bacterium]|nr:NAD-dependent epimerase/dehydratase family protein [Cyclobacteriaceae bacterium]
MNILITGASGFVGRGLLEYLSDKSDTTLFVHSRSREWISKLTFAGRIIPLDVCTTEILNVNNIDCVIHLAGIAHDLDGKYTPADYEKVNTQGTIQMFDAFNKSTARVFVFMSSIKAAVDTAETPVDEDVVPAPTTPYGKSKQNAEAGLLAYSMPPGKFLYILRPVMIHGKGNKGNLNLLYRYVQYGLPYVFGAYDNQRSFLTADNLNFIIHRIMQGSYPSGVYHVCDDAPFSTTELISIIAHNMDRSPRIWSLPKRIIEPLFSLSSALGIPASRYKTKLTESLVASNARIKKVLGVDLPVSAHEGLSRTLKSFREH